MMMTLYNGVSGIKTHQFGLDSWSNNISNVNTNGYRQNLPEFSTIFSVKMEYMNSNETVSSDIGHGSTVGANAIDTRSGSLIQSDDSPFNVAITGDGWFTVGKNQEGSFSLTDPTLAQTQDTFFTRNGEFNRDGDGYIVNNDGYYLYGIDLGKISDDGIFTSGDDDGLTGTELSPLKVPKDVYYRPVTTSYVDYALNLNKNSNFTSVDTYTQTEDGYDETKFDALDVGVLRGENEEKLFDAGNNSIDIQLYDSDGNPTTSETLTYGTDFTSIGELMSAINSFTGANMHMNNTTGCNVLLDGSTGADTTYLSFSGAIANSLNLPSALTALNADETASESPTLGLSTLRVSSDVYDETGQKMILDTRLFLTSAGEDGADTWSTQTALYDSGMDTMISDTPAEGELSFDAEGTPAYTGDSSVTYDGGSIDFDLTGANDIATTNYAYIDSSVKETDKDGSPEGRLSDVSIDDNGIVNLAFSNGKYEAMGRIGMAAFINDQGLTKIQGNLFQMQQQSVNGGTPQTISGSPIVMWDETTGNLKNTGISQGLIETSNVDLTTALTELIVMQRGYQANAKSITTGDDMLKEAIGLKK